MQDMERVLRQEEEELQRQQRMVEIDRREAELCVHVKGPSLLHRVCL